MYIDENQPFVSIVVPVYNGEKYMEKCLENLFDQTYPKDKTEIIVVDNNSTDNTSSIIDKYNIIRASCSTKGPSATRNKGMEIAKGDIIVFVDADCLADKDLVKNHVLAHIRLEKMDPKIKLIGGGIAGYNTNFWSLCDDYCSWLDFHPNLKPRNQKRFCPTANLSLHRDVIEKNVRFDERLLNGDDLGFGLIAEAKGFKFFFEPSAKVRHINRTDFKSIIKHPMQWGKGDALLFKYGYHYKEKNKLKALIKFFISTLLFFLNPFYYSIQGKRIGMILFFPFVLLHRLIMWSTAALFTFIFIIENSKLKSESKVNPN